MASQAIVPQRRIVSPRANAARRHRQATARNSGGSLFQWVILISVLLSAVWAFLGSVPE